MTGRLGGYQIGRFLGGRTNPKLNYQSLEFLTVFMSLHIMFTISQFLCYDNTTANNIYRAVFPCVSRLAIALVVMQEICTVVNMITGTLVNAVICVYITLFTYTKIKREQKKVYI